MAQTNPNQAIGESPISAVGAPASGTTSPDPGTATRVLRRERFDLNALYETSRLLGSSLDLQFVLSNLLFTAMSKLLVTRGAVLLFEPIGQQYRVAAVRGIAQLENDQLIRISGPSVEMPLVDEDVPPELKAHRVKLVLPVRSGHRDIGLIALGAKATAQPFESRELDFIQLLVNMTSASVHNSLIVSELTQANRDLDNKIQQLNTLFDLSQEFNASLDRKQVVKALSFALMGQMLVHRYLLLLRRSPGNAASEDADAQFTILTWRGMQRPEIDSALSARLCQLRELAILEGEDARIEGLEPLRGMGIAIVIPILQHGETCGVLGLGPKMTGQRYETDDLEFLYALGNLALVSIQNTFLVEEQIEKERLEEEMRLARQIQERLLPREIPTLPGLEIGTLAIPSREVGGDYFDVIRLDEHRLLAAIADVTGKGVPASLLMANLQACLHVLEPMDMTLEEAVSQINRVICENTEADKFITFFCGIYDCRDRTFSYVNAGHNPPFFFRTDDIVRELDKGGLLLGVMRGLPYEREIVQTSEGELIVMFTDGVTEASKADGEEFGEERLMEIVRQNRALPPRQIADVIFREIRDFTGSPALLQDDVTVVVLKMVS